MLQDTKKTHTEVKQPQISIPRLADYMAASEQAKRTIAQSCKYRAIARVVQHDEAKAAISSHMLDGSKGVAGLKERAATIRISSLMTTLRAMLTTTTPITLSSSARSWRR